MSQLLQYSVLKDVFFPPDDSDDGASEQGLYLQKLIRYLPSSKLAIRATPLVVFDFETTGLDARTDRIIEIGALRIIDGKISDELSYLIKPDIPLPSAAARITGITEEMLMGQPSWEEKLPEFLDFIKGAILVAHNAEFDMAFLTNSAEKQGYQLAWPCFCTLKLARQLLPQLESKNLDSLAAHYGLSFEARHRSVGDCKVTYSVLSALLASEGQGLQNWQDLQPFAVGSSAS